MTDKYILQAREMLAAEHEKQYCPTTAGSYRNGDYDGNPDMRALARVLREHDENQPPQPTFEQRCEALAKAFGWRHGPSYAGYVRDYDRHLSEIMSPPVDPLLAPVMEALREMDPDGWPNEADTENFRKALADRGLKIVPEEAA